MFHSIPESTGLTRAPLEVPALAEHPTTTEIKDSAENGLGIGEISGEPPPQFQVLVGSAATVYPSLAIGARGAILALACALPEKCVALFELFRQGQHEKARELQFILGRASKMIVSELSIAGVKHAMDQRGYRGGIPRLPLLPLHHEQKKRLTELLASLEPAALRACFRTIGLD